MKKSLYAVFCLGFLFISINFAQNQPTEQNKSENSTKKEVTEAELSDDDLDEVDEDSKKHACQLPANVIAIKLSREEIILNCQATDKSCSTDKIIEVKTTAVEIEGEEQKYVYTVSAGKIVGKGANVRWDLSDVITGNHTITVGIDMPGYGVLGQTQTKVISVKDCLDCK